MTEGNDTCHSYHNNSYHSFEKRIFWGGESLEKQKLLVNHFTSSQCQWIK